MVFHGDLEIRTPQRADTGTEKDIDSPIYSKGSGKAPGKSQDRNIEEKRYDIKEKDYPGGETWEPENEAELLDRYINYQEAHKYLLTQVFDTKWEQLEPQIWGDPKLLQEKILGFLRKEKYVPPGSDEPVELETVLDVIDQDEGTLLSAFLSRVPTRPSRVIAPRRIGPNVMQVNADTNLAAEFILQNFNRRRKDLLRYLMNQHGQNLCSYPLSDGSTFLKTVVKRSNARNNPSHKLCSAILELFVAEYPQHTAKEINDSMLNEHEGKFITLQDIIPAVRGQIQTLIPHLKKEVVLDPAVKNRRNTVLHLLAESATSVGVIKALVRKYKDALRLRNDDARSPYQHRLFVKFKIKGGELGDPHFNEQLRAEIEQDEIAEFLKLQYMRFTKQEDTIAYLYGPAKRCEIHLDLREIPEGQVTEWTLRELISSLEFETILRYVRIPKVNFHTDSTTNTNYDKDNDGRSRKDCRLIFQLLKEKGVRKIIRIVVDEDEKLPHTDEMIISLKLQRFEIEEWDWNIKDLCSETIFHSAPKAKKLVLYSTGNNAVLRSWSMAGGLPKFANLEEVHVGIFQKNDSYKRLESIKKAFIKAMESNVKKGRDENDQVKTKVIIYDRTADRDVNGEALLDRGDAASTQRTNAWLSNMEQFANLIVNIVPDPVDPKDRIKVAIIDDGIDLYFQEFNQLRPIQGQSFNGESYQLPWWTSSNGHGTLMARLISRVCPRVQLYVARLHEGVSQSGNIRQPTAESAAKAVNWAISQGVDIISMSWTIQETKFNKDALDKLQKAIECAAREHQILLFGSASDQGLNTAVRNYPGAYNQHVICIGAALESGHLDPLAAPDAPRFAFPGVCGQQVRPSRPGKAQEGSGSSIATALAAGLAALILHCAELTGYGKHRKELRKFDTMTSIFDAMIDRGKKDERGETTKYISVRDYFEPNMGKATWGAGGEDRLKQLMEERLRPYLDEVKKQKSRY